jgi:Flp pilus assembly pilin Flp
MFSIVLIIRRLISATGSMLVRAQGQTMAEYGVILAVVALIVVIVAALLGVSVASLFSSTAHKV